MQQQSHIFVFSTVLANKGAEAVRNGQFLTIISFHCAQPDTKKFLQKFPLKNNQFNRPGWLPNLNKNQQQPPNNKRMMAGANQQNFGMMKNNPMNPQQPGNMMPGGPGGPMSMQGNFPPQNCNMNNADGNMMWGQGNSQMNMGSNNSAMDPLFGDSLSDLDQLDPNCLDPSNPANIPSLQGVKVPDEDLTPQQRQQRALKLEQLNQIKQMFKQENPGELLTDQELQKMANSMGQPPQMNQMPGGGPGPGPMNPMNPMGMNNTIRHMKMGPQNPMNDNMMGGGMPNPMQQMAPGMGPMGNNGGMNNNSNHMHPMQGGNMNMPPMNMPGMQGGMAMMQQKGMSPNMGGNPEWQKMQSEFEAGKRKGPGGMPPGMCGPMDGMNDPLGPNPNFMNRQMPPNAMRNMGNIRGQGPPPPYHQASRSTSVSMATQSPNPNSPNNPTSNLSLPSPRAGVNSALNSPAPCDPQQRHMGMKNLNTRQSPTNNSSQGSPASTLNRQINHSSPSTPVSSHLSPSASIKDLEMNPNIPSKLNKFCI